MGSSIQLADRKLHFIDGGDKGRIKREGDRETVPLSPGMYIDNLTLCPIGHIIYPKRK